MPLSGLGLPTMNLPTTFEMTMSIHYEDAKGATICGKWGVLGQLGVPQGYLK